MPFVSTWSYSKLVLRAVSLGDAKMLQKLINDEDRVSQVRGHYLSCFIMTCIQFSTVCLGTPKPYKCNA